MIKLNSEQLDNQIKNGVYVFTTNCFMCIEYIKELKKVNTKNWFLIDCDVDTDYYTKIYFLEDMPCTRIYKDNVIMYEKSGVLYDKQLKDVIDYKF